MNLRTELEIVGVVIAAALVAVVIGFWVQARDGRIRAEATEQAQGGLIAQNAQSVKDTQSEIDKLTESIGQMRTETAKQIATLDSKFSAATSPAQIASLISATMKLPQPIQMVTPPATAANPNPQPVAEVPAADAPAAKQYTQDCEECKAKVQMLGGVVNAMQTQLDDKDDQLKADADQLAAMTKERDTWKKAAKGGGFLERVKRAAKWFGIGAVTGAIAVCGTGHCK